MTNRLVLTVADLRSLFVKLIEGQKEGKEVGFDYETSGFFTTAAKRAFICGVSFSVDAEDAWYVPLGHENGKNYADEDQFWTLFGKFVSQTTMIAHNALFELKHTRALARFGSHSTGQKHDITFKELLCSQIDVYLTGQMDKELNCKAAIRRLTGKKRAYLKDLFNGDDEKIYFPGLDPEDEDVLKYACDDAMDCLTIHRMLQPQVGAHLLYRVDQGLNAIFHEMYQNGWPVDKQYMGKEASRLRLEADRVSQQINRMLSDAVGTPVTVNPGSTQAVGKILFTMLRIPPSLMTPGGKPSTSALALEKLAPDYPVVQMILDYRSITKLASTYYEGYQEWIDPIALDDPETGDSRDIPGIRPNYIPHLVSSGRTASKDPNLQNVPEKQSFDVPAYTSQDGKTDYPARQIVCNVRDSFVAPDDWYFLFGDFSQIEFRLFVGASGEKSMLRAYKEGIDVHALTASKLYKKPVEKVTKDERAKGKTCNFAILYGSGAYNLAQRFNMSKQEGIAFLKNYFDGFPAFRQFIDSATASFRETGYIKTKFGRVRHVPEYRSPIPKIREHAARSAVNSIIQGGAADIQRIALNRVKLTLSKYYPDGDVKLCVQTHDDMGFMVHSRIQGPALDLLMQRLAKAMCIAIPDYPAIEVEFKAGISWGQTTELRSATDWDYPTQRATFLHVGAGEYAPKAEKPSSPATKLEGPVKVHVIPQNVSIEKFGILKQVLRMHPGQNVLVLRVNDDDVELARLPMAFSEADRAVFEDILGPCTISTLGPVVADVSELVAGITF
jgi:DNA polymerase-1